MVKICRRYRISVISFVAQGFRLRAENLPRRCWRLARGNGSSGDVSLTISDGVCEQVRGEYKSAQDLSTMSPLSGLPAFIDLQLAGRVLSFVAPSAPRAAAVVLQRSSRAKCNCIPTRRASDSSLPSEKPAEKKDRDSL